MSIKQLFIIKLVCYSDIADLQYHRKAVVQQYIARPLLIGGYKFDLRLYAVCPSLQPLTIYIYQEGLARFATERYDLSSLDNHYSHLTNTSINRQVFSLTLNFKLFACFVQKKQDKIRKIKMVKD